MRFPEFLSNIYMSSNNNTPNNPPNNPWDNSSKPQNKPNTQPTSHPWGNQPHQTRSPWRKQPSGGGGNNGSGNNGGSNGGGNLPPFLQSLTNNADEMPPHKLFGLIFIIVMVFWALSGLYRVQPEENGVVLRFGKYMSTVTDPGLHYHLPWPVETVLKPNVMFERRIELGYRSGSYGRGGDKTDIPEESMMLTGDANIVDLDFVVQWKISDAKEFLFNIREAEGTLKRVAESAMREVIGQNALQDIITDRREDIAARVKQILQDILNSYQSGIMVTQVLIQDASVPAPVIDAFEDVIRATQQAETIKNQALRYRNEIIPRAQGDAIRLVKEAEAYKEQIVSQATGDAQRFMDIYNAYLKAKNVTRERMYLETWQYILENNRPVILDGGNNVSPLSYLNLNNLRSDMKKPSNQNQANQSQAKEQ